MKTTDDLKGPENFDILIKMLAHFDTEQKCIDYCQLKRWGGNPICAHCNHSKVYKFSDGRRFKCAKCRKQFTVKTRTIFGDSNISFRKWFAAIYMAVNYRKGISSYQLARDIKVTQRTAWFMLQRIRHKPEFDNDPNRQLEDVVKAMLAKADPVQVIPSVEGI
jgi:transposase-like protein